MSQSVPEFFNSFPRGYLFSLDPIVFLRFQINPTSMVHTKESDYNFIQLPGIDQPVINYRTSGPYYIDFDLFFNSTDQSSPGAQVFMPGTMPFGVAQVEAAFQMLSSRKSGAKFVIQDAANELQSIFPNKGPLSSMDKTTKFRSTPNVYFVYGARFWMGKLLRPAFKESNFRSHALLPQNLEVSVRLIVIEAGPIYTLNQATTKYYSIVQTTEGVLDFFHDMVKVVTGGRTK